MPSLFRKISLVAFRVSCSAFASATVRGRGRARRSPTYRCENTELCSEDLLLEDALAQVRCREHRDEPGGTRRPERQGTGPTGIEDVSALSGAGCDPPRRQQQRSASPAIQGWLDFHGSQGGGLGSFGLPSGEEHGQAEPGDIEAGGIIPRAVPPALGVLAAEPWSPVQGFLAAGRGRGGKGPGWLVATRTGVGSSAWLHLSGSFSPTVI
jgi:hypothetical protein